MACRVGITTRLDERKAEWENELANKNQEMRNWVTLYSFSNREEAQAEENRLKMMFQCEGAPGGREPDEPNPEWYVYYFEY